MFGKKCGREVFAWVMTLVMLTGMMAVPALATEEVVAPAEAPVSMAEAPVKAETSIPTREESPAKAETPVKAEEPTKTEAPVKAEEPAKTEAPAKTEEPAKTEAPAKTEEPAKAETPVKAEEPTKTEAPVKTEAPAKTETPVKAEEPVKTEEPAKTEAPAKSEAPAETSETPEAPADDPEELPELPPAAIDREPQETGAALFSAGTPANRFAVDWSGEDVRDTGWAGQLGVVEGDNGYYIYSVTGEWSNTYVEVAAPGQYNNQVLMRLNCYSWNDPSVLRDDSGAPVDGSRVTCYTDNGQRYSEIYVPASALPASKPGYIFQAGDITFDFTASATRAAEEPFQVDWEQVEWYAIPYTDNQWSVVQGDGGYYLYFEMPTQGQGTEISVFYAEEPSKKAETFNYQPYHAFALMNGYSGDHEDAQVNCHSDGSVLTTEIYLPAEHFPEYDFTLMGAQGQFVESADIPLKPGQAQSDLPPSEKDKAVYGGIAIDGSFRDWDAVPKHDMDDFHDGLAVDQTAIVWDGDYIYIYFAENGIRESYGAVTGTWNSVTAAGPNSNGQFAITTDLGRTLLIQPRVVNDQPTVAGIDGATAAVNNKDNSNAPHRWELAIPASALPEYRESFSFGLYMVEPIVTGITNLQDDHGGVGPFGANVVIDGKYNDWIGYPHQLIQYDTPGIEHHKVDGEGALWSNDGWLYGHVVTEHSDHLAERGSEYLAAISIAFNGDHGVKGYPKEGNFYPRILSIDENGIHDYYATLNEGNALPNGAHTFYIFDTRTDPIKQFGHTDENGVWHDATAADLINGAFGTMKITVTGTKDDMEFCLDLSKVADYIGQDGDTAFKTIEAQFGRIGQTWLITAGTPTGPVLGVALAVGAIGAPVCYAEIKKRRGAKKADLPDESK